MIFDGSLHSELLAVENDGAWNTDPVMGPSSAKYFATFSISSTIQCTYNRISHCDIQE